MKKIVLVMNDSDSDFDNFTNDHKVVPGLMIMARIGMMMIMMTIMRMIMLTMMIMTMIISDNVTNDPLIGGGRVGGVIPSRDLFPWFAI